MGLTNFCPIRVAAQRVFDLAYTIGDNLMRDSPHKPLGDEWVLLQHALNFERCSCDVPLEKGSPTGESLGGEPARAGGAEPISDAGEEFSRRVRSRPRCAEGKCSQYEFDDEPGVLRCYRCDRARVKWPTREACWPEGEDFRLACRQAVLARMDRVGSGPYPGDRVLDLLDRACALYPRSEKP